MGESITLADKSYRTVKREAFIFELTAVIRRYECLPESDTSSPILAEYLYRAMELFLNSTYKFEQEAPDIEAIRQGLSC